MTSSSPLTSSRQLPEVNILPRIQLGALLLAAILLAMRAQALFSTGRSQDRDTGIPYALAAMITFSVTAFLTDRWLGKAHDLTDCPTAPHKTKALAKTRVVAKIRLAGGDGPGARPA